MTSRSPHPILVAGLAAVVTFGLTIVGQAAFRPAPPTPRVLSSQPVPPPASDPHAMHHMGSDGGVFADANARMHAAMSAPSTGDVDRDFAAGMIPHHEGAIEMARIEIEKGRDPEMRRLARSIVESQTKETATMRIWMLSHAAEKVRAAGEH